MESDSPGYRGAGTNASFHNTIEGPIEPTYGPSGYLSTEIIPATRETSVTYIASEYQEFPEVFAHLPLTGNPPASFQEIYDVDDAL
ncbi:hypothetical protein N7539_008749 [Penicillium diatomitis]|uniref:Uncharacterized protein n=1 Tax=Penicillium diatomitis TaxID=2819901 RepID=A0A9W9WQS8_9EURO|nr:uncharacterized protein N7539_008749 [Penicillium diatomitis]KAJ5471806.1 hypothetical protein N7539_008749 [Penicillium diatomitis]